MKAIIVAEGRGDLAVLSQILKGSLDIDLSEIKFQSPEYEYDQTDLFQMSANEYGGWNRVKQTCINHKDVEIFLDFHEESILIVQIDAAERNEIGYEVALPVKSNDVNYCELVFDNVSLKIQDWLTNKFNDRTAYAVCVEEIEAWLLALYVENTSKFPDPKKKFDVLINKKISKKDRKTLSETDVFKKYYALSKPFSKKRDLPKYVKNNISFDKFYNQLIVL